MWTKTSTRALVARPKAQGNDSREKSLLSKREPSSGSGESAVIHSVQLDLTSFSDGTGECDYGLAVANTVEILSVAGSDDSVFRQEKEARSAGEI